MNAPGSKTLLVTGATGFIGRAVADGGVRSGTFHVRGASRQAPIDSPPWETVSVPSLSANTDWGRALGGIDVVIHTAARVHVMRETTGDPLSAFRAVNVDGTMALAHQAVAAGVKRFVFVSSIKVNGEMTDQGRPFRADDMPAPRDAYGISKAEAEGALSALAASTDLELVILRPVIVYGAGVKGNFRVLMKLIRRGVPLPFGLVHNRRSLVGRDNLVDLLLTSATHGAAAGRTFLVSDGEDLSTPELIRRLANAMGTRPRLLPVPPSLLSAAAGVLGKADLAQRLWGSLQVDMSTTREVLGWTPPLSVNDGLARIFQGQP